MSDLPAFFPCESFVQKSKDFCDIELNIFKVKIVLVVLLHLKEVVKLQIKLKQPSAAPCDYD